MKNAITLAAVLLITAVAQAAPATQENSQKRWVSDLPGFINENPSRQWVVGQSTQPALSATEAETLARRDAAAALVPLLQPRVRGVSEIDLRRQIEASLAREQMIVDRQVESVERPYGTIWRESILIDASPKKLDELARRMQSVVRSGERRRAAAIGGGTFLSLIVGVVYLFLNWITRGYFRARLAMASMTAIALGIATIVHLV